jgi:hypothetical protein
MARTPKFGGFPRFIETTLPVLQDRMIVCLLLISRYRWIIFSGWGEHVRQFQTLFVSVHVGGGCV